MAGTGRRPIRPRAMTYPYDIRQEDSSLMEDPKQAANLDDESWMKDMGWGDDEATDASADGGLSPEARAAEAAVAEAVLPQVAAPQAASNPEPAATSAPEPVAEPISAAAIAATTAAFAPFAGNGQDGNNQGIDLLLDVSLQVSVELGRTRMKIGEILGLRSGSVIELDRLAGEPADILVNGTLIAKGEVVVVDEKFGVRIIEVVSRAKRIASLS